MVFDARDPIEICWYTWIWTRTCCRQWVDQRHADSGLRSRKSRTVQDSVSLPLRAANELVQSGLCRMLSAGRGVKLRDGRRYLLLVLKMNKWSVDECWCSWRVSLLMEVNGRKGRHGLVGNEEAYVKRNHVTAFLPQTVIISLRSRMGARKK
jgi:hypothetical protein